MPTEQKQMNKIINNKQAQEADEQKRIFHQKQDKVMISDFAQTKNYKSKTQPNQIEQKYAHASQPYVNPVIKHTLESLPVIYGGKVNRKRKYNLFMKSKLQLNNIISRVHDRNYMPNQRLYKRMNENRSNGYSAFDMNDCKGNIGDKREQITKTVTKKVKKIATEPNIGGYERSNGHSRAISNQERVSQALATPKSKKFIRLQSLDELAKPKENCKNQYCSCKSIYEEYQKEINNKMKQKLEILSASRHQHNYHKINLPRLSIQIAQKPLIKLDDQESKHKVSFHTKINSLNDNSQSTDNCCNLCKQQKKQNQISQKGILGLIKKKQLEQKRNKLAYYSRTQQIDISLNNMGTQMTDDLASDAEAQNQEYGTQADLINHPRKLKTIDRQINTDFEQQNNSFRHLENNSYIKDSVLKKNKKESMQHLSHLKEKYKYEKRSSYKSKYGPYNEDDEKNHQNDQESQESRGKFKNTGKKKQKQTHGKRKSRGEIVNPLNTSNDSIISDNSIMNHLANALATNGKDKSTIFKLLKKKQEEETEHEDMKGRKSGQNGQNQKQKNKKPSKSKNQNKKMSLINDQTGLFSIPQQQQYVDYLKGYQPIQSEFKIKDLVKSQNFKILKYKDTLYFGEASADNTKNGKALLISPKQIFEGVYQNGVKMSGCQRNIDGVYMGEFLNGMRHGEGKWIWNNGQVYEGEWKLGTKNGFGVWKSTKGDSYEGQWVLNRQQGKGIHRHKNSVYEGEFVQALKEGQGRQKYINGDEYIGSYYKGRPHGKGKYIWKNGNVYEGEFRQGLRSGYGKWTYSNKVCYEGEFNNDFKHGKGKQTFVNGDQYEGQYYEGQKINGVYIEAETGKAKQIKVEIKNKIKNEQKHKEIQTIKSRLKTQQKQQTKSKIKQEPTQKPEAKEIYKSVIELKHVRNQNEEQINKSKIQIEVCKKKQPNHN